MSAKKEKLIIIDGNALIHRSFHALPPGIATKKGEITNAVYGFASVLIKAIREFKPQYVVLTLDKKGPTFRHKEYKEYKAQRVAAPDELYSQIPRVKELAESFGIPIFEKSGFEADDLIGTISRSVNGEIEKIIVTGDLDTLQLINEHTKVYTMSRGISDSIMYDAKAVKDRFGLKPDQMVDYKALRGDPSDNIPGVKGIGEKTAIELLKEFKSLEGIYKNLNSLKIKERIKGLLTDHKDDALMSKRLAMIECGVEELGFDLQKAAFGPLEADKIIKLFSELEFRSLLPRLKALIDSSADEKEKSLAEDKFERNRQEFNYVLVDDEKDFQIFLKKLKKQKSFTFDTEATCLKMEIGDLLGISFSWEKGSAYYLNFKNKISGPSNISDNLFNYKKDKKIRDLHPWLMALKPIFEDKKIKKSAHNAKFDYRVMKVCGIETQGLEFDTMIASYLLNPGTRQHNLDALVFSELGFEKISKEDLLGVGKQKISFGEIQTEKLFLYSCEDADFTERLVRQLSVKLKSEKLQKLFAEIEMPLVPVLAKMEENGIKLDIGFLDKMEKELKTEIKKLEKSICGEAGCDFNINSTQQLREVLFEKLGISSLEVKKNKTGFSTAAEELAKLRASHSIIPMIENYRELSKLLSTYVSALPKLVNSKTGRLHTSFNQTITATGRLSSTEPNLQNIPIKTELGRKIRQAFTADTGNKLLSLDYSQIELRLAAHYSGDLGMIRAFENNEDIHSSTAAAINELSLVEVSHDMRREAKAINFGILYGQGPHGLSQTAGIPYARAKEFIEKYFETFPGIKKYVDETIEKAKEEAFVATLFGRKRPLPEINSSVMMIKKAAERMAVNTPLQGSAADIIKIAMIQTAGMIEEETGSSDNPDIRMLLQVHDELLFEVKEEKINHYVSKIKNIMENIIKLKVPIIVDAKAGDNWGELKNIKK
jgi:DNA polymerase I